MHSPKILACYMLAFICVAACKKDHTSPGSNCRITTIIERSWNGIYTTYNLEYDEKGRVTKYAPPLTKDEFDYSGNGNSFVKQSYDGNRLLSRTLFGLNETGLLTNITFHLLDNTGVTVTTNSWDYKYNNKGELQTQVYKVNNAAEKTTLYTWVDGDCIQTNEAGGIINYTYYPDKMVQDGDGLAYTQLIKQGSASMPRKNKHLVKSVDYTNYINNYAYEFNSQGLIIKMYKIYTTNTEKDTTTYSFEYTCK